MPTLRIKESYGPPVVPKDATPQQRQAILQEHRKHIDFVKQLNDVRGTQDDEIADLQGKFENGRIIGQLRVASDGVGNITRNIAKGVSVAFAAGRFRVTFSSPRPIIAGVPHYNVEIISVGTGFRIHSITNVLPERFDVVIRNAGGELLPSGSAEEVILTIIDYD